MEKSATQALFQCGLEHQQATPAVIAHTMGTSEQMAGPGSVEKWCDEVTGLGPLAALVRDDQVTDVLVNSSGPVWVDRGHGLQQIGCLFASEEEVRALAARLAQMCGRRLDDSQPWVDGLLPNRIRLHAIIPPLATHGTHISLRIQKTARLDLDELQRRGMFPVEVVPILHRLVDLQLSYLVTGGTGTGKTTLLAALLERVPTFERIVIVEDAPELQLPGDHIVNLASRHANPDGHGRVDLGVLVRQALRMRPDRIVLGECRGAEIQDLLTALNTGHRGGCATLHANSVEDTPRRVHALGALAGMSDSAVSRQLAGALQVVLHLERESGERRLAAIGVMESHGEVVQVSTALSWSTAHRSLSRGDGWPHLCRLLNMSSNAFNVTPHPFGSP